MARANTRPKLSEKGLLTPVVAFAKATGLTCGCFAF